MALLGLVALGCVNVPGCGGESITGLPSLGRLVVPQRSVVLESAVRHGPSQGSGCQQQPGAGGRATWKGNGSSSCKVGPWCCSLRGNRVAAPAVLSFGAKIGPWQVALIAYAGVVRVPCTPEEVLVYPQVRHRDKNETTFPQEKLHVLLH